MSYFKPKSVTWWSGVACIGIGALNIIKPETLVYGELLSAFVGGASMPPAMMIATGLGLIGVRAKMERG